MVSANPILVDEFKAPTERTMQAFYQVIIQELEAEAMMLRNRLE